MSSLPAISRRHALKGLLSGAAGAAAVPAIAASNHTEPAPALFPARHVFQDPDFTQPVKFPWEKLLSAEELATTQALADLILPKDDTSPAASEVGVPDFINEWVSADYPQHHEDREIVVTTPTARPGKASAMWAISASAGPTRACRRRSLRSSVCRAWFERFWGLKKDCVSRQNSLCSPPHLASLSGSSSSTFPVAVFWTDSVDDSPLNSYVRTVS
ncbi:MAG TPA: hypothetical protein DDZ88_18490 [Verrucomicrobiales bacterium]|nr:hypothetical protein [Verrucomicrobiales bacterium]